MANHGHHPSHEEMQKSYIRVFLALLGLTATTIAAAELIHFPHSFGLTGVLINLTVGILIAVVKVALVMYIFMHLKFDNKYIRAFVFVPVFLFFVMVFALTVLENFNHP